MTDKDWNMENKLIITTPPASHVKYALSPTAHWRCAQLVPQQTEAASTGSAADLTGSDTEENHIATRKHQKLSIWCKS